MKKILVVGIIVLFISIGVQPVIGDASITKLSDNKEQKENIKGDENPISLPFGFILVRTYFYSDIWGREVPEPWVPISCVDLNTGATRWCLTNFLGLHLFKFLPIGHDYKLSEHVKTLYAPDVMVEDMGFFFVAGFNLEQV